MKDKRRGMVDERVMFDGWDKELTERYCGVSEMGANREEYDEIKARLLIETGAV